jgi:2-oxoglutarate ferredoxin oxidoreductase subunit delta
VKALSEAKEGTRPEAKHAKPPVHVTGRGKNQTDKKKKQYLQFIFKDWCKGCRICSSFCPRGVLGCGEDGVPSIEQPERCIGCRFCELHCPDFAITIKERSDLAGRNGT